MNRAQLSRWFFPVLIIFVHLAALISVLGDRIFLAAANGFVALISAPTMREDRVSDLLVIVLGLEAWSGPAVRILTAVCGGLVAFAVIVLLRQRKDGDASKLEPIFWGCTVMWAYLILAGMLFQSYYHELIRYNFHYDDFGGRSFLINHLRQRGSYHFLYPAVLLMISWLGTWKPRSRFIGVEATAAIHHLRASSGEVLSTEPPGEERVASRMPDIRIRLHPALGVLVASVLVISNYQDSLLFPPAGLLSPLMSGKLETLLEMAMPRYYDYLRGAAYVIATVCWGSILLSALFLVARAFVGRRDDLSFGRFYWMGVRVWSYLFLIGMCLYPGMPGRPEIYPTPIILLLPYGMLLFAWLGERRLWKHAIAPEQAATIPLAQVPSGSIPAGTPAP